MFFSGDLRSGITAALQQNKSVACFVRDNGEESHMWENEFLVDPDLSALLSAKTILLRLQAGSEEAGFLAEIYPLPKTPTLVIILKGELQGYLVSGISKADFIRRVQEALNVSVLPTITSSSAAAESRAPALGATSNTNGAQQSPAVQSLLEERRVRMEAQKREQDARLKAEKAAAAAARQAEIDGAKPADPRKEENRKYAAMQNQRQKEARAERERILRRVEDDKRERREREALRKEQARATAVIDAALDTAPSSSIDRPTTKRSAECAVQVRLFDGTTIRSRFPSNQTLREHVRAWVDEQRGDEDEVPYSFKQILTPLPNHNIGDSEEEESLQDIGLCPSATLVLVEVKDFTPAYQGGGIGLVKKSISTGYGLLSSGVGMVTGVVGSLLGGTAAPAATQPPSTGTRNTASRSAPEDQQFYNGNSLSFEPRRDDINKDE